MALGRAGAKDSIEDEAHNRTEALGILYKISILLNTGLDRYTLDAVVGLCELGVNPKALAEAIKELRAEAQKKGFRGCQDDDGQRGELVVPVGGGRRGGGRGSHSRGRGATGMFKDWADKVVQFVREERIVWLVKKCDFPDVGSDSKVSFWRLGPDEADGVDHDKYWVLDLHVPVGPYMKGAIRRVVGWNADKVLTKKKCGLDREPGEAASATGGGASSTEPVPENKGKEALENTTSGEATPGPVPETKGKEALENTTSGEATPVPAPEKTPKRILAETHTYEESTAAPAKRPRKTLEKHISNEDSSNDEASTKSLAKQCEEDCKRGRYFSKDPLDSETAHFKARLFVAYLKREEQAFHQQNPGEDFAKALSVESRFFFQFLASWLLDGDTYEVAGHFASLFEEAKKLAPALVPKVSQAIVLISRLDLLGDFSGSDTELEAFGLPPKQILALAGSKFLKSFRRARFDARFLHAKTAGVGLPAEPTAEIPERVATTTTENETPKGEVTPDVGPGAALPAEITATTTAVAETPAREAKPVKLSGSARLELVKDLLGTSQGSEAQRKELEFAATMMTSAAGPKACYLLKLSVDDFALLHAWFPDDENACLARLLRGVKYKDMPFTEFLPAVKFVQGVGAAEALSNPVVKSLVALYGRLHDVPDAPVGAITVREFVAQVFAEVATLKLGVVGFESKELNFEGIPGDLVKDVCTWTGPVAVTLGVPAYAIKWCQELVRDLQQKPPPETASPQEQQVEPPSPSVPSVSADQEGAIKVGDTVVITKSPKDAAAFLNQKARVDKILPSGASAKLTMLEGPRKNTETTRALAVLKKAAEDNDDDDSVQALAVFGKELPF